MSGNRTKFSISKGNCQVAFPLYQRKGTRRTWQEHRPEQGSLFPCLSGLSKHITLTAPQQPQVRVKIR